MPYFLTSLFTLLVLALPQTESIIVGPIDFFGYGSFSPQQLRASLPIHEGDKLSYESKDKTVENIKNALKQQTGKSPSDVATICCDNQGRLLIYIGLTIAPDHQLTFNPVPQGRGHLPTAALKVHQESAEAWQEAMNRGVFAEDNSHGFALSIDPVARAKQLLLHTYAMRHTQIIQKVLLESSDARQRQIAAEMLGYARRSPGQVQALVHGSLDPDKEVRNNALRALWVLSTANGTIIRINPDDRLIGLLGSSIWTDRNKSVSLFDALTARRDPLLLSRLRAKALNSLVEMARWQEASHASSARMILGRMAGIEEESLVKMAEGDQTEVIINAVLANGKSQ